MGNLQLSVPVSYHIPVHALWWAVHFAVLRSVSIPWGSAPPCQWYDYACNCAKLGVIYHISAVLVSTHSRYFWNLPCYGNLHFICLVLLKLYVEYSTENCSWNSTGSSVYIYILPKLLLKIYGCSVFLPAQYLLPCAAVILNFFITLW